jgi:hypothetical protein
MIRLRATISLNKEFISIVIYHYASDVSTRFFRLVEPTNFYKG